MNMGAAFFVMSCSPDSEITTDRSIPCKPNIIYIFADDLGYGDLGSYGQKHIKTPYLDHMAAEGMRFTDHYAGSTVCAPSRSVLLTGMHTGRTPIRGNRRIAEESDQPLPHNTETIFTSLKDAGYSTGAFGKWGMGGIGSSGLPSNQGVDEFYGQLTHRHAHFYYPEFLYRNGDRDPLPGNRVTDDTSYPGAGLNIEKGVYSHDAVMDEALSFVRRHGENDNPFFLYLPLQIPHAEMLVPEDELVLYLDENGESPFVETPYPEGRHYGPQPFPTAAYAAMITRMDRDIGRLYDLLKDLGLDNCTLVIFSSDNGSHAEGGYHPDHLNSSGPLRGYKRDLYEGGIRVPMIARWPGVIELGTVSNHISGFQDMLPTFSELAGVSSPENIDGISMVPELTGIGSQQKHKYLYWEFHELGGKQAVRMERWKAVRLNVRDNPDAPIELYDLENDIGETDDIASEHPDVVRMMKEIMKEAHVPSDIFPLLSMKAVRPESDFADLQQY